MAITCDVAIIGGGPAAATLGTLLRKYNPALNVVLFEREVFPRDHVGESQIPHLMPVLHEMEVWDKVEAANFPIKIGGRYKWGTTDDLWSLDFIPIDRYKDEPRPAKFEGQRMETAFQVDRSIYDKILLDHAKSVGCQVYEGVKVATVNREGDKVTGFTVAEGDAAGHSSLGGETEVKARFYIDASGNSGLLRRTMGVEIDAPSKLRNIAVWDYWQNTEWAERIGVGGTRILTLSVACGWLWFIPIGPTRTSIGLVVPAEYVKKSGKKPEQLYAEAIASEPTISELVKNATREDIAQATKDWSFVADRLYGENWFLAGDAAGFADPILSAGLTLAQLGSRNLAYTILAIDRADIDEKWLKQSYDTTQKRRIKNHIRFADFWYSSNGHFSELKEYCSEIAEASGVRVAPNEAFVWMGSGGFANEDLGVPGAGTFAVRGVKFNIRSLTGVAPQWEVEKYNSFKLNIEGATEEVQAFYFDGRISQVNCYRRGSMLLPDNLSYGAMLAALKMEDSLELLLDRYVFEARKRSLRVGYEANARNGLDTLEAMLAEGWVTGEVVPEGRFIGLASTYPRQDFHVGWREEGKGLTSVDPSRRGTIMLPWDEFMSIKAAG